MNKDTVMNKLHESLVKYFAFTENLYCTWNQLIKTLERPIESLKNEFQQLHDVSSNLVGSTEICQTISVQENLIFKINMRIDDEIAIITSSLKNLKTLHVKLKNKFQHLNTLKADLSENDSTIQPMHQLVKGTSRQPPLYLLLDAAEQVYQYYFNFYNTVNSCYVLLDRNDAQTIEKFALSLNLNNHDQTNVMKIMAVTQFFIS